MGEGLYLYEGWMGGIEVLIAIGELAFVEVALLSIIPTVYYIRHLS